MMLLDLCDNITDYHTMQMIFPPDLDISMSFSTVPGVLQRYGGVLFRIKERVQELLEEVHRASRFLPLPPG